MRPRIVLLAAAATLGSSTACATVHVVEASAEGGRFVLDADAPTPNVDADRYMRRACARGYRVVDDEEVVVEEDRIVARLLCDSDERPCTRSERRIRYVCERPTRPASTAAR